MYSYAAVDTQGRETRGIIQVANQAEALQRIKEMGFFPVKITESRHEPLSPAGRTRRHGLRLSLTSRAATSVRRPRGRVKSRQLTTFTRQLATLLDAGMPLLRSLRLLNEQEPNRYFKAVIADLALCIEAGGSFSEALAQYPKIFDRLYVNMIKAGELGGMLETSLKRLPDFMEKTARIKGRIKAAMFYPAAVITVATGVMALMLLFVVPRFKEVFAGLNNGRPLPAFSEFVFNVSTGVKDHFVLAASLAGIACILFLLGVRTEKGRVIFDRVKLRAPVVGTLFRKLAIGRFARTLGTLITSGVPILQALAIVREATGNVVMGRLVGRVRDNVEQGESIVGPLRESKIFPALVVGMVDVGEQTGALPEMLNRIADNYDEEVDNSVAAMMSLLEPMLIVFLAAVVGSVVVAMFLLIINIDPTGNSNGDSRQQ